MVCLNVLSWYSSGTLLRYRDEDFQKFNSREDEVKLMQSQYKQMQMRLESVEGVKAEMEDNARYLYFFLV